MASGAMPAYLRRTAISGARVPAQVTRRTWPARSSKSASQTQEMSRPSAMRSLSATQRSSVGSPFDARLEEQRAEHLVGAGRVLDQEDGYVLAGDRTVSTRPKTARISSMARAASGSAKPSRCAAASAASAL